MALSLSISIVAIANVAHADMTDAINRTLEQIVPEQLLIFTDDPHKIPACQAEYHLFSGDYIGAMHCLWYEVPEYLHCSHFLWLQQDGWVLDEGRWTDEFLQYDYIGAPWPVYPGTLWYRLGYSSVSSVCVGNGGFSLRSTCLARYVAERRAELPPWLPEDDCLCRIHRGKLEAAGFRWAPADIARRFSRESTAAPSSGTFGFHNCGLASEFRANAIQT